MSKKKPSKQPKKPPEKARKPMGTAFDEAMEKVAKAPWPPDQKEGRDE